jgi:hypothetical protein
VTPLWFVLAFGVAGVALAFALPRRALPRSPIGETMPKGWTAHPRTVVQLDPDGAA